MTSAAPASFRRLLAFLLVLTACGTFAHVPVRAGGVEIIGPRAPGALLVGRAAPGSRVRLDSRVLKVADDGHFVFGFGRDAPPRHLLEVEPPGGRVERITLRLSPRRYPIERVDGLPPKTVTPPPEWQERRAREIARVHAARSVFSDRRDWQAGFRLPAQGRVSGVYGSQRILNGRPRSPHYGLDIAAHEGTPVVAPAGGIVRLAAPDFLLEGGIVIIDHGFGVSSTLFHLKDLRVHEGEEVRAGQRIASMGMTGRATGPHVDWRVNWGEVRLDPALALALTEAGRHAGASGVGSGGER